jgi:uncharacterized membrane protein
MPGPAAATRLLHASWLGLLAWQVAWHALLPAPYGSRNWILAGLALAPLVALSPGLLRGTPRGRFWSLLLVMLYFIVGVVEAWSNPGQRLAAAAQVFLCVSFFTGLVLVTRLVR